MSLREAAEQLLSLRSREGTSISDWEAAKSIYENELVNCNDPQTIRESIQLDSGYDLPPQLRKATHERWLKLERTSDALRSYAWYLSLFYSDEYDQETRQRLYDEADALDKTNDNS